MDTTLGIICQVYSNIHVKSLFSKMVPPKPIFFWKNSEPSCFLYFWHVYIGSEWIQWHLIWVLNILHIYIVFLIFWEGIKSMQVCQSLRYYEVIIRIDLAKYKLYVKPSLRGNFELCQMVKKRQENRYKRWENKPANIFFTNWLLCKVFPSISSILLNVRGKSY